jgi:uncharacterized protein YneF (UPF0154 family)
MGELIGIPEWLFVVLWLAAGLSVWLILGFYFHRKAHRRLAEKRPNPTREEFLALMAGDVDHDIAEWMWENLAVYYTPLAPHPDDHLLEDACIDDGDVSLDWLPAFAESQGLAWKQWPEWPKGWDLTVRNFARWLQLGRASAGARP